MWLGYVHNYFEYSSHLAVQQLCKEKTESGIQCPTVPTARKTGRIQCRKQQKLRKSARGGCPSTPVALWLWSGQGWDAAGKNNCNGAQEMAEKPIYNSKNITLLRQPWANMTSGGLGRKQQKCMFSHFWKLQVQDPRTSRAGFLCSLFGWQMDTSWLLCPQLVLPCTHISLFSSRHQWYWIRATASSL